MLSGRRNAGALRRGSTTGPSRRGGSWTPESVAWVDRLISCPAPGQAFIAALRCRYFTGTARAHGSGCTQPAIAPGHPGREGKRPVLKHLRNSEDFEQKNLLQKGFTLVELLVVIVILGILAAVVVFAVGGSTDKAQENSCKTEKATTESAVEAYRVKAEAYPTNIKQLVT